MSNIVEEETENKSEVNSSKHLSVFTNEEREREEINKNLQEAIEDFVNGKGPNERPNPEHCRLLINYYKPLNDKIVNYFKQNIKSISVMPYGDEIIFAVNPLPICIGSLTTVIRVTNKEGKSMDIYFDRN